MYHSALVIGTKPYSVQFKVDIPNSESSHNYAGHKISDIKIAPTDNADGYLNSPMQDNGAISKVSLAVLRGKVNPARQKNGKLFSRVGYASMRNPLEGNALSTSHYGEGESGHTTHGYGVYV